MKRPFHIQHSAVALAVICGLGLPVISPESTMAAPVAQLNQAHDKNAWLEIHAENFENNINVLAQQILSRNSSVCAVMKADAYGHGISLLIPSVIKMGIERICVANNTEARIAREQGFKGTIIRIRIASIQEIEEAIQYDVEEIAGSQNLIEHISMLGKKHQRNMSIHLNLNSAGMSRNGLEIDTEAGKQKAMEVLRLSNIEFAGIMTHFPDENQQGVKAGLEKFKSEAQWIIENGNLERSKLILHCANTYATTNVKDTHLDMVRVGSLLYGMAAPQYKDLKPVMSMKTQVGSVQHYKKGDTVVYDRTFKLARDSQLANLPVGYSDGYNRSFSNRTQVLINGKRYPVVGKITMNTIMVDVTGSNVKAGDEVVLLGDQGSDKISMNELMAHSYSFYGEFFMNVGYANPKILAN